MFKSISDHSIAHNSPEGIATVLSGNDQFDSVNRDDVASSIYAICELARNAITAYREEDTAIPAKKGVV